jgi:hypothetical protein
MGWEWGNEGDCVMCRQRFGSIERQEILRRAGFWAYGPAELLRRTSLVAAST